ncbi:flagellar export protein FliJ [bacterium DOLZORAL124_64_63]|nr:MAG: flagellar export protein FliJ [bacterium DOLZORAL124_64_63]
MFHFRFDAALRHRRFLEDQAKRELAEALRREEARREETAAARSLRRERRNEMDQLRLAGVHSGEILQYQAFDERMIREIEQRKRILAEAAGETARCRESVLSAMKARKMLEILEDADRRAHAERLRKEEEKFIGDIAVGRHIRRQRTPR